MAIIQFSGKMVRWLLVKSPDDQWAFNGYFNNILDEGFS